MLTLYKTHCELGIISDEISPDFITEELSIIPSRLFRKGDLVTSKHTSRVGKKAYNLWALKSTSSELAEETVSHQIDYFKSTFLSKMEVEFLPLSGQKS